MPRLSVIIPHRRNDKRLEATLLSVLENRPEDCEVIVVHDGSYTDPYGLGDEVFFVDADSACSEIELINAGVMAACSPFVNTVLDGVTVEPGWADEATERLANDEELAAVAIPVARQGSGGGRGRATYGLDVALLTDAGRLRAGKLHSRRQATDCAAPELACGVYRRTVLLALDGFVGDQATTADVDFAFAVAELEMHVECVAQATVASTLSAAITKADVGCLADLAVGQGLVGPGIASVAREFVSACLSNPSAALAWSLGVWGARPHSARLAKAKQQLEERKLRDAASPWSGVRRAA